MKRLWSHQSLYYKLLLVFIATLMPLYLLSFTLNELSMQGINEQKAKSLSWQAHDYLRQLEQDVERIAKFQSLNYDYEESMLALSSNAQHLSDFEMGEAVRNVYNRLLTMKYTSSFIKDIYFYVPASSLLVSTKDYFNDELSPEEIAVYKSYGRLGTRVISYQMDSLFLSFNYPTIGNVRDPLYFVQVELSVPGISQSLAKMNPEGSAVLFGPDWSISDSGSALSPTSAELQIDFASELGVFNRKAGGTQYIVATEKSSLLGLSVTAYAPENKILGELEQYRYLIWILVLTSLVLLIVISLSLQRMIRKPLREMVGLFMEVERGNFNVTVQRDGSGEFGYLFRGFRKMLGEIKRLIEETYVQKLSLHRSELKQLQTQINPHFLYNTFNILRHSIKFQDYETAEELSKHLGDYFQFITRSDVDDVSLAFEYQHAVSYLEIQKIRFQSRVDIQVEPLPEKYKNLEVPRLILQPLIENAYKHGFDKIYKNGRLRIGFSAREDALCIEVENNGPGLDGERLAELRSKLVEIGENDNHTGLLNIHWRLKLKYGDKGGARLDAEGDAVIVRLLIPLLKEDPKHVQIADRGRRADHYE